MILCSMYVRGLTYVMSKIVLTQGENFTLVKVNARDQFAAPEKKVSQLSSGMCKSRQLSQYKL